MTLYVIKLISTCFRVFFTVNVAHSPSQSLEGQAEMSEPPQLADWTDSTVIDGNANQTAFGFSCAITDFSKNYTSVWLKIQLQRLFNVAYTEIYFRNEGSKLKNISNLKTKICCIKSGHKILMHVHYT